MREVALVVAVVEFSKGSVVVFYCRPVATASSLAFGIDLEPRTGLLSVCRSRTRDRSNFRNHHTRLHTLNWRCLSLPETVDSRFVRPSPSSSRGCLCTCAFWMAPPTLAVAKICNLPFRSSLEIRTDRTPGDLPDFVPFFTTHYSLHTL